MDKSALSHSLEKLNSDWLNIGNHCLQHRQLLEKSPPYLRRDYALP